MLTPIRAIAVAALIALTAAVAIPALTSAQNGGGREIAHGDRVLTRQALFAEDGSPVGRLFTDCANVGRGAEVFDASLQCVSTYRFEDGEVVSAGVAVLSAARTVRFPIVGGSGAYRGAHGEVTSGNPPKGYQGADVLHLDG